MRHHGQAGLKGITATAVFRKKSKAKIHVLQRRPFDQAAHANGRSVILQLHQPEAKTKLRVHFERATHNVVARVSDCSDSFVADELYPGGIVNELENEGGVIP